MRKIFTVFLLLFVITGLFAKAPDSFLTNWANVKKTAKAQHKLIYLHFTTDWCGWCRKIEADTYTDAKVKKALADYAAASLDCTDGSKTTPADQLKINSGLHSKFGGDGYPFLVILSEDGETVFSTISGYVTPDVFIKELNAAKASQKEYNDFQEYAKTADKKSYDYLLRAMNMAGKVKQGEKAVTFAKQIIDTDPTNAKGDGAQASWIILQQLPINNWETDGIVYYNNLKKFDGKNEKGILEEALWGYAYSSYMNNKFAKCVTLLTELTKVGKLKDEYNIYGLLGYAQASNGDKEQAIANMEKAIAIDPKAKMSQSMKEKIASLKEK